ncbi:MAG: formylglycine-generating enzyme family protein, partial [Halanaerobiaceae bacterium]
GSSENNGDYLTERRKEPVTDISWYDALVWCNALSEYLDYDPVYRYNGEVIRNAQKENAVLNAVQVNQDGFRLPTAEEWELAARYNEDGSWTPGNYASGSTGPAYPPSDSKIPDPVAWYKLNSGGRTHEVGSKEPNDLGVYDMSGNVYEWCFSESESNHEQKVVRGSCWSAYPMWLRIGFSRTFSAGHNSTVIGLRLVK